MAGSTFGSIAGLPAANARTAGVVIGTAHGGYTPEPAGRRTITILAVGSDARPGQNPLRSRADSIHVIFLQPRKGQAVIVGIPRDSWVSIPGLGTNKINAAMASGGPARWCRRSSATSAPGSTTGPSRRSGASLGWSNQVGGLQVRIPFRDARPLSGSNFHRGLKRLHGSQVLAFARDRHSVPGGDFGRQENGGRVFVAALVQFRKEYRKDPGRLLTWIGAGVRNVDTRPPAGPARGARVHREPPSPGSRMPGTWSCPAARDHRRPLGRDALDGGGQGDLLRREADGALRPGNIPRSPTGTG